MPYKLNRRRQVTVFHEIFTAMAVIAMSNTYVFFTQNLSKLTMKLFLVVVLMSFIFQVKGGNKISFILPFNHMFLIS